MFVRAVRIRGQPFGVDRFSADLVDAVGPVVEAFQRGLDLRELGFELLEDREILLALERVRR